MGKQLLFGDHEVTTIPFFRDSLYEKLKEDLSRMALSFPICAQIVIAYRGDDTIVLRFPDEIESIVIRIRYTHPRILYDAFSRVWQNVGFLLNRISLEIRSISLEIRSDG